MMAITVRVKLKIKKPDNHDLLLRFVDFLTRKTVEKGKPRSEQIPMMAATRIMKLKMKPSGNQDLLSQVVDFLTRETVKMATLQYKVAAIIKCAPFELEEKSVFRVKMFKSKWKLAAWHAANWINSLQTGFLLISLAWSMWKEPFGEKLVVHLFSVVGATLGWVFMMSLYLKPIECLVMLNQYDSIVSTTKGKL